MADTYCGHVRETHTNCERSSCMVCDLFICKVCFGCEGSLLPYCPGRKLSMDEHDKNYAHYCAGTGPFGHPTLEALTEARVFAERYYAEDVGSMPPDRSGARRFYDAVHELWLWYVTSHTCAICNVAGDYGGLVQPANVYVCNECTRNRIIP